MGDKLSSGTVDLQSKRFAIEGSKSLKKGGRVFTMTKTSLEQAFQDEIRMIF